MIKQLHHNFSAKIADEYTFEAEEKTKKEDFKNSILKSNALKRAVKEKEDKLESSIENWKKSLSKRWKHF